MLLSVGPVISWRTKALYSWMLVADTVAAEMTAQSRSFVVLAGIRAAYQNSYRGRSTGTHLILHKFDTSVHLFGK